MITARVPVSIKISIVLTVSHLLSVRLELLLAFGLRFMTRQSVKFRVWGLRLALC